jgi:multicomponent Na+:H+ antiporter subunit G
MSAALIDVLSGVFLLLGSFLGITGAVGLFRFPDFFTRAHAAGVTDTLCAASFLFGLMLQAGLSLITVKLLFILLFILVTSPTATHALTKAALHSKLKPLLAKEEGQPSQP